ncbi:MAG: VOC family protein [Planctomycetes bacterium]|nr:VOC family protein [Planctomycetota bacterium]
MPWRPHHLGLTVANLDRSIAFYRDVLGFKLLRRRTTNADYIGRQTGYDGVMFDVASFQLGDAEDCSLELVQYLSHAGAPHEPATNISGTAHLCFQVDNLAATYERLASRGVTFKSPPVAITSGPNQGGGGVYLRDPDGFTIELFEPPPQLKRDESIQGTVPADITSTTSA